MPERYGKWKTVYGRYRRWTREGLFGRILERLQFQLDELGRIDWSQFDIAGTSIRADHALSARKKGHRTRARRPRTRAESRGLGQQASSGD